MLSVNASSKPVVLAFSGHDPSGAAGIQADIETIARTGCHCVSVITSLTTQNTSQFKAVEPQSPVRFRERLELLTADINVDACKIGLIGSIELVEIIADYLAVCQASTGLPVVLDPILNAGAGAEIVGPKLRQSMVENLFPHTTVITPNLKEALALTKCDKSTKALPALLDLGCHTALVTGADDARAKVVNTYMNNERKITNYRWEKLPGAYHGSGCTLSAHIAGRLAQGDDIRAAVEKAQEYTWQTLKNAEKVGESQLHPERFFDMKKR